MQNTFTFSKFSGIKKSKKKREEEKRRKKSEEKQSYIKIIYIHACRHTLTYIHADTLLHTYMYVNA